MKKVSVFAGLVTLVVAAIYLTGGENNILVNNTREVFSPVISKAAIIEQNIKLSLISTHDLQRENEVLKKEITSQIDLYSYKCEIERLESLLGLRAAMGEKGETLAAKVISCTKSDSIIINKGKDSGINEGDTVLSINGVVGRVSQAGDKYSVVATILNPQSGEFVEESP